MAWIILLIAWASVTALVTYPYVEKIEKLRNKRDRVFSYFTFAVAGWSILMAKLAEKVFNKTGIVLDDEEDLTYRIWN